MMNFLDFDNPLRAAIVIYLAFALALYLYKPKIFFDEDGKIKPFGMTSDCSDKPCKACFTYPSVLLVGAVFIYFVLIVRKYKAEPSKTIEQIIGS